MELFKTPLYISFPQLFLLSFLVSLFFALTVLLCLRQLHSFKILSWCYQQTPPGKRLLYWESLGSNQAKTPLQVESPSCQTNIIGILWEWGCEGAPAPWSPRWLPGCWGSVISAAGFHGCGRGGGSRASQKPTVLSDLTASEPLFLSKCSPCCCSPLIFRVLEKCTRTFLPVFRGPSGTPSTPHVLTSELLLTCRHMWTGQPPALIWHPGSSLATRAPYLWRPL